MLPIIIAGASVVGTGAGVGLYKWSTLKQEQWMYDAVIKIDSLKRLDSDGWEVQVNPNRTKHTSNVQLPNPKDGSSADAERRTGIVLGVLGLYNRGKTWFINQIARSNFPSSDLIHTEGISMVCPQTHEGKNLVILDSAGSDVPVPQDEIRDKKATEAFIREAIIHLSRIIIVVVQRLHCSDQSYLNHVIKEAAEKKIRLLVVHNFENIQQEKALEQLLDEEIITIFNCEESQIPLRGGSVQARYFKSTFAEHFVYAREGSPAGKIWNNNTTDAICTVLQGSGTHKPVEVFQDLCSFTSRRLPQLLVGQEKLDVQFHETQSRIVLASRAKMDDLTANPVQLKLGSKISFDDGGGIVGATPIPGPGKWEPRHNLIDGTTSYLLYVELPGLTVDDITIDFIEDVEPSASSSAGCVKIVGERRMEPPENGQPVTVNIPEGPFVLEVPIRVRVEFPPAQATEDHGLLRIEFKKVVNAPRAIKLKTK